MNPVNAEFLYPRVESFFKKITSLKYFLYIKCEKNERPQDLEYAERLATFLESGKPDSFLKAYESRFEREYGYLRPIVEEVVDKYLDCGNPKCGFARIKCSGCGREKLLMFSCKTRGFCPSCHAKRREEWGDLSACGHAQAEWMILPFLHVFH